MAIEDEPAQVAPRLGSGQVVVKPPATIGVPSEQVRSLYRLSDPALSELGLEELLSELLARVKEALQVDTVAILLFDEETNTLVARAADGIEEEVEQGVRIPVGRGFAGRIASERVPIFIADVDHADILNPILREKKIRSLLGVPLVVEGDLIGVLHVGSLRPREFGPREVAVLQIAAARVAPGIERARLYAVLEREHRVAVVLQRSLLPRRLVDVLGTDVAARYIAARDGVGGDWYDVVALPRGQIGVAIGDVVGHGIRAAALMGQMRTALNSYAVEGHSPGRTLELVDRFVQKMDDSAMATAAYAVFDPESCSVRMANAGHPPPIVISHGKAQVRELTPAAPLGAFPYGSCPEHEFSLRGGEMLLLYTDGLVERRGVPLGTSIEALVETIEGATSAEDACRLAIECLVPPEGLNDDIALVALQNIVVPDALTLRLPAEPHVLSEVRSVLRRWLHERGAQRDEVNEITIAVSEACANAIEHAYPPARSEFDLDAKAAGPEVTVTVRDSGRWRAPRGSHRGRGLSIIEAAMEGVEVEATPTGTEVMMRRRLRGR